MYYQEYRTPHSGLTWHIIIISYHCFALYTISASDPLTGRGELMPVSIIFFYLVYFLYEIQDITAIK